jgi:hypothetical protein
MQLSSDFRKAPIPTPDQRVTERCRSEEMGINPTDTTPHQSVALNERQHLIIGYHGHLWQPLQQCQHFRAAAQGTAGKFSDNEGVAFDFVLTEQRDQLRIAPPQMLHPDRRIN